MYNKRFVRISKISLKYKHFTFIAVWCFVVAINMLMLKTANGEKSMVNSFDASFKEHDQSSIDTTETLNIRTRSCISFGKRKCKKV